MNALLLVDVGNTRVKWARSSAGSLQPQQAAEHADWVDADWDRHLFAAGPVDRVVVASVAGPRTRAALEAAACRHRVAELQFVESRAFACGVRNGYRDPHLLGVDRWAAVVGAHHLAEPRPCCVVDVGTAATVDAVLADGTHLGGYIVPGPRLMTGSLLRGTSDLVAHTEASGMSQVVAFADNTREAIERGCRLTLAALIERARGDLEGIAGGTPALVVTGGAAEEVLPLVRGEVERVPDLVLRGLLRLAGPGS